MFDRYTLSSCFKGAEVISVSKMKNHLFMGLTLCMKNLFGLPPISPPNGRVRTYYHYFIRLSHLLLDLGMITNPCLNIIDALTGQWGRANMQCPYCRRSGDVHRRLRCPPDGARSSCGLADTPIS